MALQVGSRLGHYDVTALIGEGGMGQVYQATDTKLKRQVALKILPEAFSADPERLARFQREAEVLASLNHPNIAAIHGLEEAEGIRALVLELVEGPTLADRIKKGPIPLDEALPIAKQIAEALEAAHEAGVIHRDLKPANIKVKDDGTVKVLDFGLAKALDPNPEGDPSQSPTLTAAATQMGVIMGTAAYMSPEQTAGKPTDKRSDIWSFGVVLHEMLGGHQLFAGETVAHVLAKVLERDLAPAFLPPAPPSVTQLLRRCLERNPKRRLRDIGEARIYLEDASDVSRFGLPDPSRPFSQGLSWSSATALILAGVCLGGLVTGLVVFRRSGSSSAEISRFTVSPPASSERLLIAQDSSDVAISPDGRLIAYITGETTIFGVKQLRLRALDQLVSETLADGAPFYQPFFSPDGAWVGYYDGSGLALKRVSVNGGPSLTICDLPAALRGATWADDDTIIFATQSAESGLWRVEATGGEPEQLTTPNLEQGELDHFWPEILPGGKAVLFTAMAEPVARSQIVVLSLETGEQSVLIQGGHDPEYVPTGHIMYGLDQSLRAVGFDLARLETIGNPVTVLEDVLTKPLGATNADFSANGSLVYVPSGAATTPADTLVWVDRQGVETSLEAEPSAYGGLRISPDGRYAVFDVGITSGTDIVLYDLIRHTPTRFTVDPAIDVSPMFTPDGERVAFMSRRIGVPNVFWKAADGSGMVEHLFTSPMALGPSSFSPDGSALAVVGLRADNNLDIGVLSLPSAREVEWLLEGEFDESYAEISPDGRWLAYVSNESGQYGIYVRPFPNVTAGRSQISRDGGSAPAWGVDSSELFYQIQSPAGGQVTMMMVHNETDPDFAPGNPVPLFDGPYRMSVPPESRQFDISPDGVRFLMVKENSTTNDQLVILLVQNWFEELTRLVPTE